MYPDDGAAQDRFVATLRVDVHAPSAPPPDLHAAMTEVARMPGVLDVEHDGRRGDVRVRYDLRRSSGRMIQATLRDRAPRIDAPAPAPALRGALFELGLAVTVAHHIPGRVRLRVERREDSPADAAGRAAARIADLKGVNSAAPSTTGNSVLVEYTPGEISVEEMIAALGTGLPEHALEPRPALSTQGRQILKMSATAAVFGVALTGMLPMPIVLAGMTLTGIPSFSRAIQSVRDREIKVDMLDATAIAVCILQGDPISAGAITTLLAIGDVILDRTQNRARLEITKLIQLDDGEAFILDSPDEPPRRASPRELKAGNRIVIYPGARIPADGVVIDGAVTADEKAITGESLPRERLAGDEVLAASVAVHGQAVVEVTRAGSDTTAARIVQILQGVGMKPMTLQRNAERSADRLVIPTFGIACAAYALTGVMQRLVCVLITDFGTGVRIAVPTTALASMTLGARSGLLIKGAQSIERLNEVDTVVFDKTGTLTRGVPEITDVIRLGDLTEQEIVGFAAAAETNQAHPLADAIRRRAQAMGTPPWQAEHGSEVYRIGLGLETKVDGRCVRVGNRRFMRELGVDHAPAAPACDALSKRGISSVLVAIEDRLVGVLGFADEPRRESQEVIRTLRAKGRRKIVLLSGDARAPVEAVAKHCGIDEAIAEVLPHEKAELVKSLKAKGRKVAMVGDGINDAPALALADVGISLHGATAVARETADVVLLEGGLERLPEVFTLSSDAMKRVREVLGIVILPNAAAILVGALGLITPITAAMLNNGSTIAAALYAAFPLVRRQKSR